MCTRDCPKCPFSFLKSCSSTYVLNIYRRILLVSFDFVPPPIPIQIIFLFLFLLRVNALSWSRLQISTAETLPNTFIGSIILVTSVLRHTRISVFSHLQQDLQTTYVNHLFKNKTTFSFVIFSVFVFLCNVFSNSSVIKYVFFLKTIHSIKLLLLWQWTKIQMKQWTTWHLIVVDAFTQWMSQLS